MADADLVELVRQGAIIWNGWRTQNPSAVLTLDGASLSGSYCKLKGAGIDLSGAHLSRATLVAANLANANLSRADLHHSSVGYSNLTGANLSRTNLSHVTFNEANLSGADLTGAFLDFTDLRSASLVRANLTGAIFRSSEFVECGTKFSWQKSVRLDSGKYGIEFTGVDLSGAILAGADLVAADLRGARLCGADLTGADLRQARFNDSELLEANLTEANLSGTDLSGLTLSGATLRRANLKGANLSKANLGKADLRRADLTRANLIETDLSGANLTGCRIYGVSAWALKATKETKQDDLAITPEGEPEVTVDDIEVAQFVYLLLRNEKIREVIDTIGRKGVLLLGRFTGGRIAILDRLRLELRNRGFVPIVFNFDKPRTRDFTETVRLLCGMSQFVIADITNPRSAPLELQATIPEVMVPFVPILETGEEPFAMLRDLWIKHREWVFDPIRYPSIDRLIETMDAEILIPAAQMSSRLLARRAEELHVRDI